MGKITGSVGRPGAALPDTLPGICSDHSSLIIDTGKNLFQQKCKIAAESLWPKETHWSEENKTKSSSENRPALAQNAQTQTWCNTMIYLEQIALLNFIQYAIQS